MRREWAPAAKPSQRGVTFHLSCYGGRHSHCDHRIDLLPSEVRTALTADGPPGVITCKRCQAIARHLNAAQAERV